MFLQFFFDNVFKHLYWYNYCYSINIHYWLNTDIIAWFKRLFGFTGSSYVKFGYCRRMLDKDEESNECRNCGRELDDDANFYTFWN
ncbi:hypothetical protein [uncultured Methanobrevibacter sp.]|uniref:hypothetical protein n=1 Tax=uncultured Methanobrevibacter sp. TaxID=253161 RepID=UPI0025CC97DD|nr:hypothetical protein [uncultured Methanobrevibacter sp.]